MSHSITSFATSGRLRIYGLIVALASAFLSLAACQDEQKPVDLTVDTHDGTFVTIQQFVTPGGVSVWLVEEPSIPILSLNMGWKAGSASDPAGIAGLTQAMSYHMNEGAGAYDAQAFFKRMEELNMSFGCGVNQEDLYCTSSMLIDNLASSFDMVALAFAQPRFDAGPLERFKREQEVSLKTRETNPRYLAERAMRQALYPDHPYARQIDADSLARITREAMRAQKDQLMTHEGLIVTAVGAISAQDLAPLIDTVFSSLPSSHEKPDIPDVIMAEPAPEPIIIDLPQPQSLIRFAAPAIKRDHPDYYTAIVLNHIFGGGGFSSRLMQDLRVEKGLTYGVYSSINANRKIQTWSGGGQTKNESAGVFIAGIKENMAQMARDGVSEQELVDAKSYLTGSYPLGFDSNAKIASRMMSVRMEGLPVDFFDTRNNLIQSVTRDDINRLAAEYLVPDRFTFVVVGEPEEFTD